MLWDNRVEILYVDNHEYKIQVLIPGVSTLSKSLFNLDQASIDVFTHLYLNIFWFMTHFGKSLNLASNDN